MRRLTLAVSLAAALALPASAQAAFFPAEVIDGPSGDILELGDVDLARDGNGAAVYLKRVDGVAHVFVSRFVDGAFTPGERLDGNLAGPSSQPVVASADGNRTAVAFVNNGALWTVTRARGADAFAAPTAIAEGGVSNPSVDLSVNGATYVSYTQNGDVKVARANRDTPQFTVLPAPVDFEAGRVAGVGELRRSRIATAADGTALVVWGELDGSGRSRVYGRRLFELRLSTAPQDLTLDEVDGQRGTDAEIPELDMEDDSSYAQVVFRQNTTGGPRLVMRRLVGSAFEPPMVFGATPNPGRVDLTGRGEGMFAFGGGANEAFGGTLVDNKVELNQRFDAGNAIPPQTTPAVGENEDGAIAWLQGTSAGDATARARFIDSVDLKPVIEGESLLSVPEFGPVDQTTGFDASSSRAGDVTVVFVQGTEGNRRLVGATYDKPPARPILYNTTNPKAHRTLRWAPSLNLFGPVAYRVLINGRVVGETAEPELRVTRSLVRDGVHTWQVQAVDRRNQVSPSKTRNLRVDLTPPSLSVGVSRRGRTVTVSARAADRRGRLRTGLSRLLVDFGDGRTRRFSRRISKTYSRGGTYEIRVRAIDRGGAVATTVRRVRVG